MFEQSFTATVLFPLLGTVFFAALVVLLILTIARKIREKATGTDQRPRFKKYMRFFQVLALVSFLVSMTGIYFGPKDVTLQLISEAETGPTMEEQRVREGSNVIFANGSEQQLLIEDVSSAWGRVVVNNTDKELSLYRVFYACDDFNWEVECSSPPDEFLETVSAFSIKVVCCRVEHFSSRKFGPPSTITVPLGSSSDLIWLTWGEADQF